MSMVYVKGLGEVEFNDYEHLLFTDGWNGGQWNNWEVILHPHNYNIIHVSDEQITLLKCVSKKVYGVDDDMGREYSWESNRLYVIFDTVVGECEMCLSKVNSIMYSLK